MGEFPSPVMKGGDVEICWDKIEPSCRPFVLQIVGFECPQPLVSFANIPVMINRRFCMHHFAFEAAFLGCWLSAIDILTLLTVLLQSSAKTSSE